MMPLFGQIPQILNQQGGFNPVGIEEPELRRICGIIVHGAELLTGSISRELMKTILQAFGRIVINRKTNASYLRILERLMKRCRTQDDEIHILYHTVQGSWHGGTPSVFRAVYEQQKQNLTVSGEQMYNFCYFAANSLIWQQEYALAETLLKENLRDDVPATSKAASYYELAECAEFQGNAEMSLSWLNQGVDYVKFHPECDENVAFYLNSAACGFYVKFGMQDAARPLVEWLSELIRSRTDPVDLYQYAMAVGTYELYFGDPERALEHYQKVCKDEFFWENDPNQFKVRGQMAIALQRLKRYEEALDVYLNLLKELEENDSPYLLHVYSNNISVVYLELGRPQDALTHLETAMIHARQSGGIALAETQRNHARAFGQLGNSAEELACLKEAAPLLEEAYGAEHPRTQAAIQRLKELET